jgi:hypothetical protein
MERSSRPLRSVVEECQISVTIDALVSTHSGQLMILQNPGLGSANQYFTLTLNSQKQQLSYRAFQLKQSVVEFAKRVVALILG